MYRRAAEFFVRRAYAVPQRGCLCEAPRLRRAMMRLPAPRLRRAIRRLPVARFAPRHAVLPAPTMHGRAVRCIA